jgi:phage baseplate assembly protein W
MGQDLRVVVPNEFDFLRPTSTNRSFPVRGLDKLVQIVTKAILTNPGRDIFAPEYGAGLRDVLPTKANESTSDGVISDVTIALLRVEQDIKRFQQEEGNTEVERLASLSLLSLEFDVQNGIWEVILDLVSESGQEIQTPIII